MLKLHPIHGRQELGADLLLDSESEIMFWDPVEFPGAAVDCEADNSSCVTGKEFDAMGLETMPDSGLDGLSLVFKVSRFKNVGVYGFSVAFENGISSIKFDFETKEPKLQVNTVDSAYNTHVYKGQPVRVATKIMSQIPH